MYLAYDMSESDCLGPLCTEPTSTAQAVPRVGFHVVAIAKTAGNQVSLVWHAQKTSREC